MDLEAVAAAKAFADAKKAKPNIAGPIVLDKQLLENNDVLMAELPPLMVKVPKVKAKPALAKKFVPPPLPNFQAFTDT